jgi:hypothetical protein
MRFSRKIKVASVVVVGSIGIAAAAFAFWTGGGSGTGAASAGTTAAVTVNQTGAAITGLYPGGPAAALSGNFSNPNSGPVYIANVTAAVHAFSVQADGTKPACTQADFAITGTANVNAQVPSGTGGSWSGLSVSLTNGSLNQDNCKLAPITIDYTANAS